MVSIIFLLDRVEFEYHNEYEVGDCRNKWNQKGEQSISRRQRGVEQNTIITFRWRIFY